MTVDEARAVLGPDAAARIEAAADRHPPLTPAQITLLTGLLALDVDTSTADAA